MSNNPVHPLYKAQWIFNQWVVYMHIRFISQVHRLYVACKVNQSHSSDFKIFKDI